MQLIILLAHAFFLSGQATTPAVRQLAESTIKNCRPEFHTLVMTIAFKESSFRSGVSNITSDVGIMQINAIHGHTFAERLDINFSVKEACKLLDTHYKFRHNDKMWFARYHSKTKSLKKEYYESIWKLLSRGHYEKED